MAVLFADISESTSLYQKLCDIEARNVVEQVVSQVQGLMPETLDLAATIVRAEPGQHVPSLLDD